MRLHHQALIEAFQRRLDRLHTERQMAGAVDVAKRGMYAPGLTAAK